MDNKLEVVLPNTPAVPDPQHFDQMTVDFFEGRISGGFDIPAGDARYAILDEEALIVVRARVAGATVGLTANGDVKRVNSFKPQEAVIIRSSQLRKELCDALNMEHVQTSAIAPIDVKEEGITDGH